MTLRWVARHDATADGAPLVLWEVLVDETDTAVAGVMRFAEDGPTYAATATERSGAMVSDEAAREWCVRKVRPN